LRSPANSSDRATRSALVQPNLLQELRNFGRFCGMGGLLSIHLRPTFSVEGQVGMSTSICSPGWGTGRSSAATSTPYKNLGKFDRARWDMAPTGSPSTHAQGPSLRLSGRPHEHSRHRPSRRDLRELVYNGLHDRSAGNGHYSGPSPSRPAPRPAAHDVRGLQLHPSTRTSTSSTSTARRLFACDGLRNAGCWDSTLSSASASDRGT
jgi:hypothetical protein